MEEKYLSMQVIVWLVPVLTTSDSISGRGPLSGRYLGANGLTR